MTVEYAVVIPTVGRSSLHTVLTALATGVGPAPAEVVVVDDRGGLGGLEDTPFQVRLLRSGGRGPAAARNVGWRAVHTEWVAFLDDDVVPAPDWPARLHADLADLAPDVGGSQARIEVPLPAGRRPTDWERSTAGLTAARWITADMAYRRAALERVGGFDERFPRAFREDADLALRVMAAGYRLVRGERTTTHPVRPAGFWTSVRVQAGNADNALMRRLYGAGWRARAGEGPGRLRWHAATAAAAVTAAAAGATAAAAELAAARSTHSTRSTRAIRSTGAIRSTRAAWSAGGRRPGRRTRRIAATAALAWAALTAEFALRRILPGPRTPAEIARMVITSITIPPVALAHRLAGELRWAGVQVTERVGGEVGPR